MKLTYYVIKKKFYKNMMLCAENSKVDKVYIVKTGEFSVTKEANFMKVSKNIVGKELKLTKSESLPLAQLGTMSFIGVHESINKLLHYSSYLCMSHSATVLEIPSVTFSEIIQN